MPRQRSLIGGAAPRDLRSAGRRALAALACALAAGAALLAGAPSSAASLREVRIGRHAEYTRVVFETDAPVRYRVTREASGELRVRLEASAVPRRVGSKSEVLREVVVEGEGSGSVAHLALSRGEIDVREMVLDDPPRIVLDLTPRSARATAVAERAKPRPAPARAPETARAPRPAPAAKPARAPAAPAPRPAPEPAVALQADAKPAPLAASGPEAKPAPTGPEAKPAPSVPEAKPAPVIALAPRSEAQPEPFGPPAPVPGAAPAPAQARPEAAPAPATAAADAPAPAPAPPAEPPRQPPLELQLVAPAEPPVDDAAAARLAKAERELERLAGIPEARRARKLEAARRAAAEPPAAAPRAGAAPPAPPADVARLGAAEEDRGAARAAEAPPAAEPAPAAGEDPALAQARRERRARRERAAEAFQPTAPAPGALAFLPSPFDDPLVLGGIGALLALIGALALVRRRAALQAERTFASPFDAAPSPEAGVLAAEAERGAGAAGFEPVSASPVAAPTAEMGPLFASATLVPDEEEGSVFDVTAEETVAEDVDTPPVPAPPAFEPAAPAPLAAAAVAMEETELSEEEMRLIEELERRLAHLETRLEEVVDAKERLERHVAAQTEELRVQRAAIARTQRVLRTVVKPEDVATEPVAKP